MNLTYKARIIKIPWTALTCKLVAVLIPDRHAGIVLALSSVKASIVSPLRITGRIHRRGASIQGLKRESKSRLIHGLLSITGV